RSSDRRHRSAFDRTDRDVIEAVAVEVADPRDRPPEAASRRAKNLHPARSQCRDIERIRKRRASEDDVRDTALARSKRADDEIIGAIAVDVARARDGVRSARARPSWRSTAR